LAVAEPASPEADTPAVAEAVLAAVRAAVLAEQRAVPAADCSAAAGLASRPADNLGDPAASPEVAESACPLAALQAQLAGWLLPLVVVRRRVW